MLAESYMLEVSGLSDEAVINCKADVETGYILQAAIDLMVNGLGYDKSKVTSYLDDLGLNTAVADSVISYVEEYPGMLLPYGVGLASYLQLKSDTEKKLGNDFDVVKFNEVIVKYGDRSLTSVENDINTYLLNGDKIDSISDSSDPVGESHDRNFIVGGFVAVVGLVGLLLLIRKKKR